MLLADLVAVSDAVASTSSRTAKIAAFAEVLRDLQPEEIPVAVAFLTGAPRQGKVGIGWATLAGIDSTPAAAPSISVLEVDETIDRVLGTRGSRSAAARRDLVAGLLERATAREADFIRRLFVGELRQGALEGVMGDAIAKAAGVPAVRVRRAAMLTGDLGEAAGLALGPGGSGLDAVQLQVLRPVLPMLAGTAESVAAALEHTGRSSVEWKLDGARIQVHRAGEDVRIFTRNLNDITARLPDVVELVRAMPVDDLVLDGEAIGVGEDARPDRFQETMRRFSADTMQYERALRASFFDVLRVDGSDLLEAPLRDRLEVLARVAEGHCIPSVATDDPDVAAAVLEDALAAGHEGVMVKSLESAYDAGRRGGAWRKVKPVRTLDLVVLAVEWGHGRRRGWLSNLHLGARDGGGGFVMVGKTFKGLTDQLLTWQTARLQELAIGQEGHIVHVKPELVVEIALDGVQVSPRYPGGVALRFARVRRYRPDRSPADADTIETVQAML